MMASNQSQWIVAVAVAPGGVEPFFLTSSGFVSSCGLFFGSSLPSPFKSSVLSLLRPSIKLFWRETRNLCFERFRYSWSRKISRGGSVVLI